MRRRVDHAGVLAAGRQLFLRAASALRRSSNRLSRAMRLSAARETSPGRDGGRLPSFAILFPDLLFRRVHRTQYELMFVMAALGRTVVASSGRIPR